MKIKKIVSQHRRDFTAIYECEHCGHEEEGRGYDDTNFHANVVPLMECKQCGKVADETYRPLATKYPDGMTIQDSKWNLQKNTKNKWQMNMANVNDNHEERYLTIDFDSNEQEFIVQVRWKEDDNLHELWNFKRYHHVLDFVVVFYTGDDEEERIEWFKYVVAIERTVTKDST